jgi:hypothetical protein
MLAHCFVMRHELGNSPIALDIGKKDRNDVRPLRPVTYGHSERRIRDFARFAQHFLITETFSRRGTT